MVRLGENTYGKSHVRLSRIVRLEDRHVFEEWSVRVLLTGDFEASFTAGDNSRILPTDTMKNTVYSVARASRAATLELFAIELGDYLLANNSQAGRVLVEIEEKAWEPLAVRGTPHPSAFKLAGPELHTVRASRGQGKPWSIRSGVDGLTILKTSGSEFTGYLEDRLTTLKPSTDRIFGTRATIAWEYASAAHAFAQARARIMAALLKVFAEHHSLSVQHTVFEMGKAALEAAPEISRIKLTMPNLHHLLADLSPFGQDNPNHIFVSTGEPHGYIEATIER